MEHGFSALVSVRTGGTTTSVLFDTGLSPEAMVTNADRLDIDFSDVTAGGAQPRSLLARRRPGRTGPPAANRIVADGDASLRLDPASLRAARRRS
jgi:hypothetical protein